MLIGSVIDSFIPHRNSEAAWPFTQTVLLDIRPLAGRLQTVSSLFKYGTGQARASYRAYVVLKLSSLRKLGCTRIDARWK